MTLNQYIKARMYLAFRLLVTPSIDPPSPAECVLYESCFAYQRNHE